MSDRLALGLAALAFVFLVGVVYAGATMPQRPKQMEYTIEVETTATDGAVVAKGATNLPTGSRLAIVVDRLYRLKGTGTWRAARVGEGAAVVENGRWATTIPVTDGAWVEEVASRMNRREIDPVEAVQSSLRTTVVFSPLMEQEPGVRRAVGPDGAGLSESSAAMQVGTYWVIRSETTAEMPLHLEHEKALLAQVR